MSISAVSASAILKPPEAIEAKPPQVKTDDGTRTPQPTVLAALPPGQGTRIDQLA
jgi:hypothetical protein